MTPPNRPGRLLRRFLEPKSLTREKTFSRLGFSQLPLALLGLLTQRQAFDFSRSLACLFCLMRELAIAAAMASLATRWGKRPRTRGRWRRAEAPAPRSFKCINDQANQTTRRGSLLDEVQVSHARHLRRYSYPRKESET